MPERPNILLLVGEDTGRHHGCYGEPYAHTPHTDRLAAEGRRYTRAFTNTPVCAPSRCGLVCGRYPWSIGTHLMRCRLIDRPRLITEELRDAGYHVHWPTKTDFNVAELGDFATTEPNWFDEGRLPDAPFFAYQNIGVTHESSVWDTTPAGDGYAERVAPLPESERHDPADAPVPPYLPDTPAVRRDIARYFDLLTVQDMAVGRALDLLERSGQAENTIVVYLSDHGRGLPREKRWCYGAGVHLPLIVRWPGRVEPGSVSDELVAWVDVAPTLLDLAGALAPASYQGRRFLGDGDDPPRHYCYFGRDRMDESFDRVRGCASRRWHYLRNDYPLIPYMQRSKYMEQGPTAQELRRVRREGGLTAEQAAWMAPTKPVEELYDAEADPHMVRNRADDPACRDVLVEHRQALSGLLEKTGDLGRTTEEDLIARGLILDDLASDYLQRCGTLPEADRLTPHWRVVTARDAAEAYGPQPGLDDPTG